MLKRGTQGKGKRKGMARTKVVNTLSKGSLGEDLKEKKEGRRTVN